MAWLLSHAHVIKLTLAESSTITLTNQRRLFWKTCWHSMLTSPNPSVVRWRGYMSHSKFEIWTSMTSRVTWLTLTNQRRRRRATNNILLTEYSELNSTDTPHVPERSVVNSRSGSLSVVSFAHCSVNARGLGRTAKVASYEHTVSICTFDYTFFTLQLTVHHSFVLVMWIYVFPTNDS